MMMKMWHNGVAYQTTWNGLFYWWDESIKMWCLRDSQKWAREDYEIQKTMNKVQWVKMLITTAIVK